MGAMVLRFGIVAAIFLALDAVWLSFSNARLYKPLLGDLLMDGFRPLPALAFYVIYVVGILHFAVLPALRAGSATLAAKQGAMLGFVAYATYDLTNQATLRIWSTTVTLADLAWGVFVTATTATLGTLILRRFAITREI